MKRTIEQRIDDWIGNGDGPFDLEREVEDFIRSAAEDGASYDRELVTALMRSRIDSEDRQPKD